MFDIKKHRYRPLPEGLAIDVSDIEGFGLFALKEFDISHDFGITHISDESGEFMHDLIRTPLGGFINHTIDANCQLIKDGKYQRLISNKRISFGEELTLNYFLTPCYLTGRCKEL